MSIRFNYPDLTFRIRGAGMYKYWLEQVVKKNKFKTGHINYIFCNNEKMLEINKMYLNHDYYTDIITFDYNEGKVINSDIYISVDMVRYNAKLYKVKFYEEMRRVMVHGILHLMGYKDKTPEEAVNMRKAESKALKLYEGILANL